MVRKTGDVIVGRYFCPARISEKGSSVTYWHARASEHINVSGSRSVDELFVMFDLDHRQLLNDDAMICRHTVKPCHGTCCFFDTTMTVIISWRLGKEDNAESKDQDPKESDAHGNSPSASVGALLGAEIDTVGYKYSERDEELVGTECQSVCFYRYFDQYTPDQCTSDVTWSTFSLVHWYEE